MEQQHKKWGGSAEMGRFNRNGEDQQHKRWGDQRIRNGEVQHIRNQNKLYILA